MKAPAVAAVAFVLMTAEANAEAWTCQFEGARPGEWRVLKNELIEPRDDFSAAARHLPIVTETPDILVAMSSPYGTDRRVKIDIVDKRTLTIKIMSIAASNDYQDRLVGRCRSVHDK